MVGDGLPPWLTHGITDEEDTPTAKDEVKRAMKEPPF